MSREAAMAAFAQKLAARIHRGAALRERGYDSSCARLFLARPSEAAPKRPGPKRGPGTKKAPPGGVGLSNKGNEQSVRSVAAVLWYCAAVRTTRAVLELPARDPLEAGREHVQEKA